MSAPTEVELVARRSDKMCLVYEPSDGTSELRDTLHGSHLFVSQPTLAHAYAYAIRKGYRPTKWRRKGSATRMTLDQAEHWRGLMERGQL